MKTFIKRWIMVFVFNKPWRGIIYIPGYLVQFFKYKKMNKSERVRIIDTYPCLIDRVSHTPFDPHYFYQAAWLARCLSEAPTELHIDVGSSINMLSVLSAFQSTIFVDYRPLMTQLKGLQCVAGTVTNLPFSDLSVKSLSSLHVLEHIGLGRYGDPLDPSGTKKACIEISRIMSPGGKFYMSIPVGRERTCFNAHRIFNPKTIVNMLNDFKLLEFSLVDDDAKFTQHISIEEGDSLEYGCGLFVFEKI